MYMDFPVVDSVDTSVLHEGMTLHIEITKYPDHSYEISNIHVMGFDQRTDQGTDHGTDHGSDQGGN